MRQWISFVVFALFAAAAQAGAPMVKKQAPGYYRYLLGDFEITAVLDMTTPLPVGELLTNVKPDEVNAALKRDFLPAAVETSVNTFLVNTGSKLVLIDTGTGGAFGPGSALLANVRAAGYRPGQIDEIYITHMHGDHVGGLIAKGKAAFPKAVLRIDKRDADYWISEERMKGAPAEFRQFFQLAIAATKPYRDAGRFRTFEGATDLVPGIRAMPAYGHTPGHTTYRVESKGETMVLWGDLMHVAAVQFDKPEVTIQFDSDSQLAMQERKKAFADAAANGWLVGVAHIAFPGMGHVRAGANGTYVWVPVNYSTLQPRK